MAVEWFPSCYGDGGLFERYPRTELQSPNVLTQYQDPGGRRHYALFHTFEDFADFTKSIPKTRRHFFETIPGEWRQKPHFDIDKINDPLYETKLKEIKAKDVSKEEKKHLKEELIENTSRYLDTLTIQIMEEIAQQLLLLGIVPGELRWYSSNSKIKKSLHLVIPRFYFNNNLECKRLWQYFQERLPKDYAKYVDLSVYSTLQNFRAMGSFKPPKEGELPRVKISVKEWQFSGETITLPDLTWVERFRESLIGMVDDTMEPFPDFEIEAKNEEKEYIHGNDEISSEMIQEVDKIVLERIGKNFHLAKVNGNTLSYQRDAPSYCEICKQTHDSIWPFVNIYHFDDQWKVYLFCARAKVYRKDPKKRKILLAVFATEEKEQEIKIQQEAEDCRQTKWIGSLPQEQRKIKFRK
jgi:hypothetical protein